MASGTIQCKPVYFLKRMTREISSHATGTNYWTLDAAPSIVGYTRMVIATSSSNANVSITGWRISNNSVVLETINMASSAQAVTLRCAVIYLLDSMDIT